MALRYTGYYQEPGQAAPNAFWFYATGPEYPIETWIMVRNQDITQARKWVNQGNGAWAVGPVSESEFGAALATGQIAGAWVLQPGEKRGLLPIVSG